MKGLLLSASISGFLAVAIGAFGAHALKNIFDDKITTFETGNRYHFYHTFASFLSAFLFLFFKEKKFLWSGWLFQIGILFFSFSLYTLSITKISLFGAITPIGGILFLAGWTTLCYTILKIK
ncbi:MAG TPA: DUF423 domain-containing protein [Leptospiraceae bacterium]|nr:DUF423 domain-containing protein [Leptospiraceae bacterium]HMW04469.1 DUF423 domain-containing protein [Leptospiraceae bacterium]HMX31127.1 DUF423 domain-containing protein [Leptospiraceae bacterium]HMY30655.1 DUF423 domain-containing protein [Leptospiraceae bacterium]HMZ65812.1 DUF423 domain-containing protein [Leptospiraceae bacterium]